jgi:hypothetical protein
VKLNIVTLVGAGAVAATFLLGGGALGHTATAGAQPNNGGGATAQEWDIQYFDDCMGGTYGWHTYKECCAMSGGVWNGTECGAPPATSTGAGTNPIGPVKRPPLGAGPGSIGPVGPTGPQRAPVAPVVQAPAPSGPSLQ